MSFVRIWVHVVFSTKNREPLLNNPLKNIIQKHIMSNCAKKGIYLQAINGSVDHIHCLISLEREQTISKVCQMIKGESSYWINERNLVEGKFQWQDDYWAVSVSESQVPMLIEYIRNQEEHHTKKTLIQEMSEFKMFKTR